MLRINKGLRNNYHKKQKLESSIGEILTGFVCVNSDIILSMYTFYANVCYVKYRIQGVKKQLQFFYDPYFILNNILQILKCVWNVWLQLYV